MLNRTTLAGAALALCLTFGPVSQAFAVSEAVQQGLDLFGKDQKEQAVKIWYAAGSKGDVDAMYYLGYAYQTGSGIGQDEAMAARIYKKAVTDGKHPGAAYNLAEILSKGKHTNASEAIDLYWIAARSKTPIAKTAQYKLAKIFDNGYGAIKPSKDKAFMVYQQIRIDYGDPEVTLRLARMYRDGEGAGASGIRALELYSELTTKGEDLPAIACIARDEKGMMHFQGQSTPRNYISAEIEFEKAYEMGSILASRMLGIIYEEGLSDSANIHKAYKFYQRAVEANDPIAMYRTGVLLSAGTLEPDYLRARDLLKAAGRLGLPEAYAELGRLYNETEVFQQRVPGRAWVWYRMALQELSPGTTARNRVEAVLSSIENILSESQLELAKTELAGEKEQAEIMNGVDARNAARQRNEGLDYTPCGSLAVDNG